MPQHSITVSTDSYRAARGRAAFLDRSDRGRIVVSGADRRTYLHGLLTNDIAALAPGTGCYAAYLTPQGRMVADLFVYELGDVILVTLASAVKDAVLARFDQFVFTEDVQLGDVSSTFGQLAVLGPDAPGHVAHMLDGVDAGRVAALPGHGNFRATFRGAPAIVVRAADLGVDGFDLLVGRDSADALAGALREAGVPELDAGTAETIRIEGGVPRFGRDMDEETIPLEAGIESKAISFTKGCYVGQEVIVRVLHRGHGRVAKKLVGLVFDAGQAPEPGTPVRVGDREIGSVTSSAWSPALSRAVALAYVHRDFLEPGTKVTAGESAATVTALPFVPA